MSTKTITLAQDAYDILYGLKQPQDSFSDVVRRIAKKRSIIEFAGIISKEEGIKWKEEIIKDRKSSSIRAKRMQKVW